MNILPGGNLVWGELPEGCKYCMRGGKLVLFITGLCPVRCYYCPVSREKLGKDVIFANERPISSSEEAIEEAILMDAMGLGVTGGEPLVVSDRVVKYIREFKENFGNTFHIHLYTSGVNLNYNILMKLVRAGLDEIRVHLTPYTDIENISRLSKISPVDFGIEIPAIPGEENRVLDIMEYLEKRGDIDFYNINQMEFSESNATALILRGFELEEGEVTAVKGSIDTAKKILQQAIEMGIDSNIHVCTVLYKDRVQTGLRLYRRAINTARPHEFVKDNGLIAKVRLEDPIEFVDLIKVYGTRNEVHVELLERIRESRAFLVEELPTHKRVMVEKIPIC